MHACCRAGKGAQAIQALYTDDCGMCGAQFVGIMALAGGIRQIVLDANTYSLFANLG